MFFNESIIIAFLIFFHMVVDEASSAPNVVLVTVSACDLVNSVSQ